MFKYYLQCLTLIYLTSSLPEQIFSPLFASHPHIARINRKKQAHKKFIIVIASYNNEKLYKKNLDSVAAQDYPSFQVIYIDDASKDQTYNKVKAYLKKSPIRRKVKLIRNRNNCGALENFYRVISKLPNHNIVVLLDGDDWLANKYVLSTLNTYYSNHQLWMAWSHYRNFPSGSMGLSRALDRIDIASGRVRKLPWRTSHLKSFYVGLFKKIRKQDLMYQGKFLKVNSDVACMWPMIEMARLHAAFIPEVLYIYNRANPISDFRKKGGLQRSILKYLRSKSTYSPLKRHPALS